MSKVYLGKLRSKIVAGREDGLALPTLYLEERGGKCSGGMQSVVRPDDWVRKNHNSSYIAK